MRKKQLLRAITMMSSNSQRNESPRTVPDSDFWRAIRKAETEADQIDRPSVAESLATWDRLAADERAEPDKLNPELDKALYDLRRQADIIDAPFAYEAQRALDQIAICDPFRLSFLRAHTSGTNLPTEAEVHFETCTGCKEWRDEFFKLSPEAASTLILVCEMDAAVTRPRKS